MKNGTKLYSVLTSTCPVCQESKMYNYGPYKLTKMFSLKDYCDHCGNDLQPEPSFYTGAMYVSYAFSVAIVISVFTAFNVLYEDPNLDSMIFTSITMAILFSPLSLRLSRNIWANIFMTYDPEAKKLNNKVKT